MAQKILVTKFNYNLDEIEFRNLLQSVADDFAAVPGSPWKIWLIDEKKKEGGAVYLFNNEAAVNAFKESPLVQSVMSHPALSNFEFRIADIVKEPSLITRAPLSDAVIASL